MAAEMDAIARIIARRSVDFSGTVTIGGRNLLELPYEPRASFEPLPILPPAGGLLFPTAGSGAALAAGDGRGLNRLARGAYGRGPRGFICFLASKHRSRIAESSAESASWLIPAGEGDPAIVWGS